MTVKQALKSAQDDLEALQADLPKIEALLREHTTIADAAKAKGAPFDEQAELRGKAVGFESVLKQHHADIQNARTEVSRLEQLAEREGHLDAMTRHALDAQRLHGEFSQALEAAHADLAEHAEKLAALWVGLLGSRNSFVNAGRPLARMFAVTAVPYGWTPERAAAERELAEAILEEVEARGADVSYSLTRFNGRHISALDHISSTRDLKYPQPFGGALGTALETQLRRTE